MSRVLLEAAGGTLVCPAKVLCDRRDGGHLIVNPRRPVWERSALTTGELLAWSLLVAATGAAMLDVLPALQGGCLNYWEAGNWALNDAAAPVGPKSPLEHRRVHMHLFGRSRAAQHPDWRWGESPRFPAFADSDQWSAQFAPLTEDESSLVVARTSALLATRYRIPCHAQHEARAAVVCP
jgi:diadenosine tetraphosphate (Ap4A) HIT family hydrolase